ncbi:unnamed protein product [Pocillopora meandrina]|uniref:receptor protein-tyrosine kinase n=1 Tax=Pocillopora meandrina TaxID=46732 RepID=A0AAU9VPJ9_9CNID|nr:unnamed protein product [Pocillopora meandrina]
MAVVVSWTLKEKNGIIKEYHVTYIREDENSETKTLATKKMEARFDLKAGKTYQLQVFAINQIGRGPAGVKNFTVKNNGAEAELLRKGQLNPTLGYMMVSPVYIPLYHRTYQNITTKRPHLYGIGYASQLSPRVTLSELTFHLFLYKIQPTVYMSSLHEYQNVDGFKLDRQRLTTVQVLGSGNFGQVCKAIYGPLRTEVAVKSLKDNALPKDVQDFKTELAFMSSLQPHPHVVKLIGCCIEKDPSLIVLEYLVYGDLLGYLRKSRGIEDTYNIGEKGPSSSLREKDLLSFAWMIADGMNYLASMKIVHRDLAARNVLVGDKKVCKISDFGLARGLEEDIYTRKTQARLPIKWMPPESLFYGTSTTMSDNKLFSSANQHSLISNFIVRDEGYYMEIDVNISIFYRWSYGIVMWEVFTIGMSSNVENFPLATGHNTLTITCESPYPGKTSRKTANLLQTGYRMPRPAHISQELYSIMKECWEEEPSKRPTFQWLCSAMKRLLDDHKTYVNLEIYDGKNYVNFDMMMDKE